MTANWTGRWKQRGVRDEVGGKAFPVRASAGVPAQRFKMLADQALDRLYIVIASHFCDLHRAVA